MNLPIDGLHVLRTSDRGTAVEYEVDVDPARVAGVVTSLVAALPEGGEISVPEPGPDECYHECQRTGAGLEIKRGCHGSHGTWRPATPVEARDWLLPGFEAMAANPRRERALISLPRAGA